MKFKVAAEVSVRPVESFDDGGYCAWHRGYGDKTHVLTVLVEGHVVLTTGACDECARLAEHGTDWRGRPARREDRAVYQ